MTEDKLLISAGLAALGTIILSIFMFRSCVLQNTCLRQCDEGNIKCIQECKK